MSGSASGITQPVQLKTSRDDAVSSFASLLTQALAKGGNIGDMLSNLGATSGYKGDLTAGQNSGQNTALSAANQAFAKMFGIGMPGTGDSTLTPVSQSGYTPGNPVNHFMQVPPTPGGDIPSTTDPRYTPPGVSFSMSPGTTPTLSGGPSPDGANGALPGQMQVPQGGGSDTTGWIPTTGGQMPVNGMTGAGGGGPIGTVPGTGALNPLMALAQGGFSLPPQLQALLTGNQQTQSGMTGQIGAAANAPNPYLQQLANLFPSNTQSVNQLNQLGGQSSVGNISQMLTQLMQGPSGAAPAVNAAGAQADALTKLAANPGQTQPEMMLGNLFASGQAQNLLNGGRSTDLGTLTKAISDAMQPQQDRNVRDLREQFSTMGLRDSTDLNQGVSDLMTNSNKNISAQVAALLPQLQANANQTGVSTLNSLGNIATQLNGMSQGDLSTRISALLGAGNLNLGSGNLAQQGDATKIQALSAAGNLNLGDTAAKTSALSAAGNLGAGADATRASSLGTAVSGANTAQGNALQALTSMLASTGTSGSNQLATLAGLFGNESNNSAAAAAALPGATSTIAQLPGQLAAQNYGLNTAAQGTDQAALTNAYNAWLQQQQLTPQILSFLGTTPSPTYGGSPINTAANAALAGSAILSAGKQANHK